MSGDCKKTELATGCNDILSRRGHTACCAIFLRNFAWALRLSKVAGVIAPFYLLTGCATETPLAEEPRRLQFPPACQSETNEGEEAPRVHYPIEEKCEAHATPCVDCKTDFFSCPEAVARREPSAFP